MYVQGLHLLDVAIIVVYVIVIILVGTWASRKVKSAEDFFISGRKLGKAYQLFLNFGSATDANQAAGVSREIYRQGIGGMWIQYLVLFLTPFYWFTTMLLRRVRLVTLGDLFTERFQSSGLGGLFAVFTLALAVVGGGASYMVAGKTMMALTPKPETEFTQAERESVEQFREYQELRGQLEAGLGADEMVRYEELNERNKRGELHSFISYTDPMLFYILYAIIVAAYTVLGGFTAAAITDAIQGVLIVTFSVMLIPLGLSKIGGFEGLHASVPDYMFELFGSASTSEYAWYTVLAMILANLVSIVAVAPMMAAASAATNENSARFGTLVGMFGKRVIMLFWALAGLLAIGLYAGDLHDPDLIWGYMTRDLLMPGAIGLMLVGVLAANMSSLDAGSVTNSALFIRNLYLPLVPNKSTKHYLFVGRLVIIGVLAGGVVAAQFGDNLLNLFKYFIALPAVFGAAIWVTFLWRRLTKWAVIVQVIVCFSIYAIIPNVFPAFEELRTRETFLAETRPQEVEIVTAAVTEDVEAGRATAVGETIHKQILTEPVGIYFERIVREDPADPASVRVGRGRFQAEVWCLSLLGFDFSTCSKAQLVATRFYFTAIFPFLLLFLLSLVTKPVARGVLDRFYGKLHTPVQPTPEEDVAAVEHAALHPEEFESKKLLPGSSWEMLRPGRIDWLGFGGSWVAVGGILGLLWLLATIGS